MRVTMMLYTSRENRVKYLVSTSKYLIAETDSREICIKIL